MRCELLVASGLGALGLASATPAAAATLPWSWGFTAVRDCSPGAPCGVTTLPNGGANKYGPDYNASQNVIVPGRGSASLLAEPGAGPLAIPELHAASTVVSDATSTAFVMAVQAYRNDTFTPLDVGFGGALDYLRSNDAFGFVTAALAIVDESLLTPPVASAYSATTPTGLFTATCATTGTMAVVNLNPVGTPGGGSAGIDTGAGVCANAASPVDDQLVRIAPGQTFFLLARLLTFQRQPGVTNAGNTFKVGLSDNLTAEQKAALEAGLTTARAPIGVPEPAAWLVLLAGFALSGTALRRRVQIA